MASIPAMTELSTRSRIASIGKLNYLDFFGFGVPPFRNSSELAKPYLNTASSTALTELEAVLARTDGGLIVVNGAPGSGKTTLVNHAVNRRGDGFSVAMLNRAMLSEIDFLQALLHAFELHHDGLDTASMIARFAELADAQNRDGRRMLLVIDEAQNLKPEILKLLPRLIERNAKTGEKRGLFVVLIGQDGFDQTLAHTALKDVKNLIGYQTYLAPLSEAETSDYIHYHLIRLAEAGVNPFSERAMAHIHMLTGGSMRLINTLCDFVLFNACLGKIQRITPELVQTTFNALQWEPVLGTMAKATATQSASRPSCPNLVLEYDRDTRFMIEKAVITIGRASDNDICIRSLRVSRYHARLTRNEAGLSIEDLGSTNGVYVNAQRVEKCQLKDGDILAIDDHRMRLVSSPTTDN